MTKRKLFHGLVPAAALTALAIAGCGSSSSNSDASFISKVNAICASGQAQANAVTQPKSNSAAEVTPFLKATLPIAQSQLTSLKAITPPSDKKADYQAGLDNQDKQIALVQQAITAGDAGNASQLQQDLGQLSTLSAQGDTLATKIGVTSCVSKNAGGGGSSTGATTT
jgi:hypothetical protein